MFSRLPSTEQYDAGFCHRCETDSRYCRRAASRRLFASSWRKMLCETRSWYAAVRAVARGEGFLEASSRRLIAAIIAEGAGAASAPPRCHRARDRAHGAGSRAD
jgi:hypothetical protein